jgi:hypothetical protein
MKIPIRVTWIKNEFEDHKVAHARGDFYHVGVWAELEVVVRGTVQRIRSGGLWGIEYDGSKASDEYVAEVFEEEKEALIGILEEMGFVPV